MNTVLAVILPTLSRVVLLKLLLPLVLIPVLKLGRAPLKLPPALKVGVALTVRPDVIKTFCVLRLSNVPLTDVVLIEESVLTISVESPDVVEGKMTEPVKLEKVPIRPVTLTELMLLMFPKPVVRVELFTDSAVKVEKLPKRPVTLTELMLLMFPKPVVRVGKVPTRPVTLAELILLMFPKPVVRVGVLTDPACSKPVVVRVFVMMSLEFTILLLVKTLILPVVAVMLFVRVALDPKRLFRLVMSLLFMLTVETAG
jgi:hypothetical protein